MPGIHSKTVTGIYPIRGILHLAHHPRRLGGPILVSTAKACIVSLVALVPLFHVGYRWQSRLVGYFYKELVKQNNGAGGSLISSLVKVLGPSTTAAVTSGLLCLAESFMVTSQASAYFVGSLSERFFDAILQEHGVVIPVNKDDKKTEDELAAEREKHQHWLEQPIAESVEEWVVEKLDITALPTTKQEVENAAKWWLSGSHIMGLCAKKESQQWPLNWLPSIIYLTSLPLTFVPVVGPLGFLGLQGICQGGIAHRRYFDLFQWSNQRRINHINRLYWQYHQFGVVSSALEMIPFIGFLFAYTNQMGAAMLLVDWKNEKIID